jgi:hypothetical protein
VQLSCSILEGKTEDEMQRNARLKLIQFLSSQKVQNECGDRLGINSFLLQPIQRLPRYQLLLNEIIKDLSKDLENMKQAIAECCIAEKNIQRLLDTVNESMSINDVRNCYEVKSEMKKNYFRFLKRISHLLD